jgi:tight adherence protein C
VLDEDMNKPLSDRFIKPMLTGLIFQIKKVIPESNNKNDTGVQQLDKLRKNLRQAGLQIDSNEYRAVQILVIISVALLLGIMALIITGRSQPALLFILVGGYLGYVGLRFYISRRITNRRESISRQLPEVLDMLSVSVEAGLGLEQAILHVNNHFKGPLIDELSIAYREMSMGRTRRDALLALGERSDVEEVNSFVRAVVQAGQMGISIKNVLRSQAEFMRQTRRNKVEEKAMQVSVKILIPMAFFIFPVIFIVLLGPAAVAIYNQFM